MRVLIQRVKEASVWIEEKEISQIKQGLLLLVGFHREDTEKMIPWYVNKISHLRIFPDDEGKMNRDIIQIKGELLVVSQFTLYGNVKSGRRPDFLEAAAPEIAIPLYEEFIQKLKKQVVKVETGQFGADMQIHLINDGPVTLFI